MPGQVLMAAPSVVPGPDGQACYGPVSPDHAGPLPAAYLTAWTPPRPAPRLPSRPVPVPPDGADRAARYVHDAVTDIAAELASRPPGGRNAAAYTAGLKAGSLLGAARATPGAERAAAAWTDEAAEQALIDAAQRNGYIDKDGETEARRAILSGLRNGLRSPRTLPDFTASRPAQATSPRPRAAIPGRVRPAQSQAPGVGAPRRGRGRETAPAGISHRIEATGQAAGSASQREHQDAGTIVASSGSPRMRANRAAVAANQAYRAGNLAAARQLIDQAAALDPARAGLWQEHREQITARGLILGAQAGYAGGDHQHAQHLLGQARELDPRMPAIWDGDLPGLPPATTARHSREPGPDGPADSSRAEAQGTETRHRARALVAPAGQEAPRPSWPGSPARTAPGVPAPRAAEEIGHEEPPSPGAAVAARKPQARAGIAASDTQPGAEPADDDPSTRWPAPNPRVARAADPPGRHARHEAAAGRVGMQTQLAGNTADAEADGAAGPGHPATSSADWRDRILADARRPWQPGPSEPRNPVTAVLPERHASGPVIEPDT
jgi:hypothetical protein